MNNVIEYIENAGHVKPGNNKFAFSFCDNHFLNDAIHILDFRKIFYATVLSDGYSYKTNLFSLPEHCVALSVSSESVYRFMNTIFYDTLHSPQAEHEFLQRVEFMNLNQRLIKIHHHASCDPLRRGINVFNSEEARSKFKNYNSEVITPYVNEKTFFNKKEDRTKNCYCIFSSAYFGQESWNEIHSHKNDMVDKINAGKYNGSKNINDLLNEYKITVSYRTDPCSYENFAAMICGCVPVLVNPITPYNESIFRNGDTCFVANSTEEANDIIETLINNKSLLNTISENIQEIMKIVNIKEKFVDKWNTVIN